MVSDNEADLAGQWVAYLGAETCCFLVQQCMDMGLYKVAYKIVERHQLHKEFPDTYYMYRVRSIKKLVHHKGLWEIAEEIAQKDRRLQEYVVRLALEMGDLSRAEALCSSFVLNNFHLTPGFHADHSEMALNVCLGKEFDGGILSQDGQYLSGFLDGDLKIKSPHLELTISMVHSISFLPLIESTVRSHEVQIYAPTKSAHPLGSLCATPIYRAWRPKEFCVSLGAIATGTIIVGLSRPGMLVLLGTMMASDGSQELVELQHCFLQADVSCISIPQEEELVPLPVPPTIVGLVESDVNY